MKPMLPIIFSLLALVACHQATPPQSSPSNGHANMPQPPALLSTQTDATTVCQRLNYGAIQVMDYGTYCMRDGSEVFGWLAHDDRLYYLEVIYPGAHLNDLYQLVMEVPGTSLTIKAKDIMFFVRETHNAGEVLIMIDMQDPKNGRISYGIKAEL